MADVTIKVLEPAESYALMTLDELKAAFAIDVGDTTHDVQLQMLIDQYSDVIATMCHRVFAKEKVEESWRGDPPPYENNRVFLTHYPVADADIESVSCDGATIAAADYEIENASGKLSLAAWAEPLIVTYTGGYALPDETPPALKAALQLLVQGARRQLIQSGGGSIRSVVHKDSRVDYFDPAASGGSTVTVAGGTVQNLLRAYMRFEV